MTRKFSTPRTLIKAAAVAGLLTFQASQAFAVSAAVQVACLGDYLNYCSQHSVGSQELRSCMRANGNNLSNRCINALVAAGEVSKAEVARRAAKLE